MHVFHFSRHFFLHLFEGNSWFSKSAFLVTVTAILGTFRAIRLGTTTGFIFAERHAATLTEWSFGSKFHDYPISSLCENYTLLLGMRAQKSCLG